MIPSLMLLAILMSAVTYPSRALPLLAPTADRLPPRVLSYLRLVGPAVLAPLAAVSVLVASAPSGGYGLRVGPELVGILACAGLVARRRNLLVGLVAAAAIVAVTRLAMGT